MRILSVGNFGNSWDGSICDEEHIAKALEELGHEAGRVSRSIPEFTNGSPEWDFTLIAQYDGYSQELLESLPRPLVYWAFDYQADGQEWHGKLIEQSDLYLSKRIADSKYPNWQYLSQDFSPQFLEPWFKLKESEKTIDVLFTGSYLDWAIERNETIRAVNDKFNLVIHSVNSWPEEWNLNVQPPIMDEKLPELISKAKINLSIDHTLEAGYWSDRNSQIMACGGFVLSRYVPLMETVFRSNITYFFSKNDCLEAIEYWLGHEEDREMIAAQGLQNSIDYKVKERTADMLNIVRNIL